VGAVDKAIEQIKSDLEPGESYVDYVVATRVENGYSGTERGALVVTSKRLIYQGTALFGGGTRVEWRLKSLNRIAATKSMMLEHIEFNAGGAALKFLVTYGEARPFVSVVNQTIESENESKPETPSSGVLGDALAKLADLYSRGLLSDSEFAEAKKKILGN
jgi:hypothetical protein